MTPVRVSWLLMLPLLVQVPVTWAELPRLPRERLERPSLELLEFIAEWRDEEGQWVEAEYLLPTGLQTEPRKRRDDDDD